ICVQALTADLAVSAGAHHWEFLLLRKLNRTSWDAVGRYNWTRKPALPMRPRCGRRWLACWRPALKQPRADADGEREDNRVEEEREHAVDQRQAAQLGRCHLHVGD